MKYIKQFERFRTDLKEDESVNEEFLNLKGIYNFFKNLMSKAWNLLASSPDELTFCRNFKVEKNKVSKKLIEQIRAEKEDPANLSSIITKTFLGEIDNEIKQLKEKKDDKNDEFKEWKIYSMAFLEQLKKEWSELENTYKQLLDFVNKEKLDATKKSLEKKLNETFLNLYKMIDNKQERTKLIDLYKKENDIKTEKLSQEILASYDVKTIQELVGKEVKYKTKDGKIAQLKVLKVTETGLFFDGEKEDFEKPWSDIQENTGDDNTSQAQAQIKTTLGEIKKEKPKEINDVRNVLRAMKDPKKKEEINKIVGGSEPS